MVCRAGRPVQGSEAASFQQPVDQSYMSLSIASRRLLLLIRILVRQLRQTRQLSLLASYSPGMSMQMRLVLPSRMRDVTDKASEAQITTSTDFSDLQMPLRRSGHMSRARLLASLKMISGSLCATTYKAPNTRPRLNSEAWAVIVHGCVCTSPRGQEAWKTRETCGFWTPAKAGSACPFAHLPASQSDSQATRPEPRERNELVHSVECLQQPGCLVLHSPATGAQT